VGVMGVVRKTKSRTFTTAAGEHAPVHCRNRWWARGGWHGCVCGVGAVVF
jgi:hypothetical protein